MELALFPVLIVIVAIAPCLKPNFCPLLSIFLWDSMPSPCSNTSFARVTAFDLVLPVSGISSKRANLAERIALGD